MLPRSLKEFSKQHPAVSIGAATSLALLFFLLVLQHNDARVLKLDTQWLVVAGIPLLIALIAGGYITRFKGFGVELEARLKNPVTSLSLSATKGAEQLSGDEKRDLAYLHSLEIERRQPARLIFIEGRRGYYDQEVVARYLRVLRALRFIEVRTGSSAFVALIPISVLKRRNELDYEQIDRFIRALEDNATLAVFKDTAISMTVNENTDLVAALEAMRRTQTDYAAVVSDDGNFIGLLQAKDVERQIANAVLASKG